MSSKDIAADGLRMRDRIASEDWSRTPLGSPAQWATSLRTVVGIILGSRFPMLLWWGADLVHVYNDGYAPILGDKHPGALGRPASKVWAEIWHVVGPMAEGSWPASRRRGGGFAAAHEPNGLVEEAYFTFSYSPAPNDEEGVGGVLVTVQESEPSRVFGERQLRLLGQLTERCGQARSVTAVCHEAAVSFRISPKTFRSRWFFCRTNGLGSRGLLHHMGCQEAHINSSRPLIPKPFIGWREPAPALKSRLSRHWPGSPRRSMDRCR